MVNFVVPPSLSNIGAGGGTTITDTDTFGGYTIAKVVAALQQIYCPTPKGDPRPGCAPMLLRDGGTTKLTTATAYASTTDFHAPL